MKALTLALAVVLGSTSAARAQELEVRQVIGATSDVHDVAVSGDRVLAATSGGLVIRRGGRVERVLGAREGLLGARLRSVSVTEDGVWAGGIEGCVLLDLGGDGPRVVRELSLRRVRRVARFGGAIWVGTYGGGLYRLAGPAADPERVDLGSHHALARVTDLEVQGGALWVSTAGAGLVRLSPEGRVLARVRAGLADAIVWDLHATGDRLLVATLGGLSVLGPGGLERRAREAVVAGRLPIRDVRAVVADGDALWVATFGAGVHRVLPGRARPVAARGAETPVARALARGAQGVLVASERGLLGAGAGGRLSALSTGGLPSADVTALARAFGALWVGTFDSGLARVREGRVEAQGRATERWGLDRRINDLAVTRDGRGRETLWIATDRGLYWHDGRRFSPALDPGAPRGEHVTALHVDRSGALWVTSSRQLARLRDGAWQAWTGDERVPVMQLHAVTTTPDGDVWVGSLHGLLRFDPESGRFDRNTVSSGALPVDWVTAVLPWEGGVVAGTYHGGLAWFDGSRFRVEREASGGLPAGWVNPHAMRFIDGRLFIGTLERGLVVGRDGRWTRLGVADGLPSDDVTDVLPAGDGTAWIATRGGLARVAVR